MFGYEFCAGYWWIFPLVMIVLCFVFMRGCMGRRMCGWGSDSVLEILDRRYAKGEIDRDEYDEKKSELIKEERFT
jgi:putative membrane protein